MIAQKMQKLRIPVVLLISLLPFVINVVSGYRGFGNPESCCFLMHYNSGASLLSLIFDPARTDWDLYQARELSYLLDAFDAKFIAWCIDMKAAHFFSLTTVLFFILTIFTQQYFTAKLFPELKWFIALLPSLVFSFSYTWGDFVFFRSSKPAVTFLLTLLCFTVIDLLKNQEQRNIFSKICIVSSLVMMPFFDRQGFFFAGVFTVGSLFLWLAACYRKTAVWMWGSEKTVDLLRYFSFCGVVSLFVSTLWNIFIAPEIIMALNGYYPSFEYQQLPSGAYFNFAGGIEFFFKNIFFLFFPLGYKWSIFAGVALIFLFAANVFMIKTVLHKRIFFAILFVLMIIIWIILSNIMTARHEAILMESVVYGIYFLPFLAILTVFFILLLANTSGYSHYLLVGLTVISILGNIALKCSIIEAPGKDGDLMFFYKMVAPAVIRNLNEPERVKKMPLPFTNSILIDFFRKKNPPSLSEK